MSAVTSQSLSTALTVITANIEGLTAVKDSILSEICYKREYCHCLCLQETHRSTNLPRPKMAGISLVVERPHNKYGSAILIRNDLKVKKIYEMGTKRIQPARGWCATVGVTVLIVSTYPASPEARPHSFLGGGKSAVCPHSMAGGAHIPCGSPIQDQNQN